MARRFFLGFASTEPCKPGEAVTITTVHDWPVAVRYVRLRLAPQYAGFDILALHVGEKPQSPKSAVPGALFLDAEGDSFIEGDPIAPQAKVSLTVMNRQATATYFGAALYVEEVEPQTPEQAIVETAVAAVVDGARPS